MPVDLYIEILKIVSEKIPNAEKALKITRLVEHEVIDKFEGILMKGD